ncbi:MAG: ribonuclease III domain-containing protein [Bacillota bacterium]|nr:ribonuclease III domain-containing protein [Bacillota bacterium]
MNPENYSPAAWAYVGDAYYELAMRLLTLQDGPKKMSVLHKETARFVRASFQALASHCIEPMLSEEEREILRRGRNTKSGHVPKSASPTEYRLSTGVEGLIGYLYLTGREERAIEILKAMRDCKEED